MWPFWIPFLVAAIGVLSPTRLTGSGRKLAWWAVWLLFSLLIGLRHEVGGDWRGYLHHLDLIRQMSLTEAASLGDPGYYVLNWLIVQVGGGIYLTNWICGALVMWGVIAFARKQPLPWLALLVAVPYLLTVVAMGYTRQSVALGLALVGLTRLGEQKVAKFVLWVFAGALFHKSAVLLFPIAAIAASRHRLWTWLWVGATTALGAALLIADSGETLWKLYVEEEMQSQGGAIRVAMNAVPAVLLLIWHKKIPLTDPERRLWRLMAAFAVACIPLVFLASTAVDRVALYFIPIQMFVFARLPLMATARRAKSDLVLAIVFYYALVMWVWLNYATHARRWIPYQFMPF